MATRTRVFARFRLGAIQTGNPNDRGKLVVDLTRNLARPPKIPGSGLACSWGPSRSAGGITFKVAPLDFDISKSKATSTNIPPSGFERVAGITKGNTIGSKKRQRE